MTEEVPRLILVSNRLPIKSAPKGSKKLFVESDGGLVSSIKSYFEQGEAQAQFSEKMWVGVADFSLARWQKYNEKERSLSYRIGPLLVEDSVYNRYYNGFCPVLQIFVSFEILQCQMF